ncbi:GNAT family N-acetyltransferase [Sphaerochaeta sp. PS]|uniref:GNAT family N-acetyltransferase n=1 Tax=Sphaerochaeta sp. PS TaxID=3076336 RepID=UPI0028A4ECAD|nr:GNAT family N-acetyltransferase [Sphaerochaeta sp. PS]MDT4762720.1 GNAT family N-acetyltransferase [Sphaerochaeta sp. PS]
MTIRSATREELPQILSFIIELAAYEKLEQEVVATLQEMDRWLFVEKKATVLFCCEDEKPIGFALYFYNYSTWQGRCGLYIEDLYIQRPFRGKGYGKALIEHVCSLAVRQGCARVEWVCLDWNKPSIDFYKRLGAFPMDEWSTYRLTGDALIRLGTKEAFASKTE